MYIPGATSGVASYSSSIKDVKTSSTKAAKTTPNLEEALSQEELAAAKQKQDTVQFTGEKTTVKNTYSKKQLSKDQVSQLNNDAQVRADNMTKMIQSMVVKQGQKSNLRLFGMDLNVSAQQSASAAKSLEPGGEYSIDAVAGRIMDMAKALSGGDASKIDKLQTAVMKGFKAAGVEMGGKLPDISNQTYNEVMKRFDDWKNESNSSSTNPSKNVAAYAAAAE